MKRAFAIFIVAILAIGMIGLFFVPLLQGTGVVAPTPAPTYTISTTTAPTNSVPAPTTGFPTVSQ